MPSSNTYATILVVDSDDLTREMTKDTLVARGYTCHECESKLAALDFLKMVRCDLIITAMFLPDCDATTFCQAARKSHSIPILVFGTPGDQYDEVACLEAGADDYLYHALNQAVLLARVRAHLRRSTSQSPLSSGITIGELVLDSTRLQAFQGGHRLKLTLTEYKLLQSLAQDLNQPVSRDKLLDLVWGAEYAEDKRIVDSHIRNLRKKLKAAKASVLIVSSRGVGYRLVPQTDA